MPVTFQIGMVGEDGMLLASDQASTRQGELPSTTTSCAKLCTNSDGTIAYCCAGDDFTQGAADDAFRIPRCRPTETSNREFLQQTVWSALPQGSNAWHSGGRILIAYDAGKSVELFSIFVHSKESCPLISEIKSRDFQGDRMNQAAFFIERYLPIKGYIRRPGGMPPTTRRAPASTSGDGIGTARP
jgi:hypothetical protein